MKIEFTADFILSQMEKAIVIDSDRSNGIFISIVVDGSNAMWYTKVLNDLDIPYGSHYDEELDDVFYHIEYENLLEEINEIPTICELVKDEDMVLLSGEDEDEDDDETIKEVKKELKEIYEKYVK